MNILSCFSITCSKNEKMKAKECERTTGKWEQTCHVYSVFLFTDTAFSDGTHLQTLCNLLESILAPQPSPKKKKQKKKQQLPSKKKKKKKRKRVWGEEIHTVITSSVTNTQTNKAHRVVNRKTHSFSLINPSYCQPCSAWSLFSPFSGV